MSRRRGGLVVAVTSLALLSAWIGVIVVVARDAQTAVYVEATGDRDRPDRAPSSTSSKPLTLEPPTSTASTPSITDAR